MYNFGDPAETAKLMMYEQSLHSGPGLPPQGPEAEKEWTQQELAISMVYASSTLRWAVINEEDEELLLALCDQYERFLFAFTAVDDVIYRAMMTNQHQFPWKDPAAVARQRMICSRIAEAEEGDQYFGEKFLEDWDEEEELTEESED